MVEVEVEGDGGSDGDGDGDGDAGIGLPRTRSATLAPAAAIPQPGPVGIGPNRDDLEPARVRRRGMMPAPSRPPARLPGRGVRPPDQAAVDTGRPNTQNDGRMPEQAESEPWWRWL